jgi:hypothetical protein
MICCRHRKKCFCGTIPWCLLQIFQINWVSILHQAQVGINLHLVPSLEVGAFCRCDTCILLLFIIILMSIYTIYSNWIIKHLFTLIIYNYFKQDCLRILYSFEYIVIYTYILYIIIINNKCKQVFYNSVWVYSIYTH